MTRILKCFMYKDCVVSDLTWDQLKAYTVKRTGKSREHLDDIFRFFNLSQLPGEHAKGGRDGECG